MKQTISQSQFQHAFNEYGRGDQFTWEARAQLFDFYEETFGEGEFELDVVGVCCDWCEYEDLEEAAKDYTVDLEDVDKDEREDAIRDHLNNNTMIIEFAGGLLVMAH